MWSTTTGAWSVIHAQTGRSKTFSHLSAGTWYIDVAARDAVGNVAPWREVKVVVPKDDRSFGFNLGTVRHRNTADFMGTDTSTSRADEIEVIAAGAHTVVIKNLGTSGRPTITVDAIGLRK